jgi:hypothetical protein
MEDSLYKISLATGRTEYDLLHKSAESWSVSGNRIDQDFKSYMADQVMPYYAKDFVRKNQAHIDESLVVKKEVTPHSRRLNARWRTFLDISESSVTIHFV